MQPTSNTAEQQIHGHRSHQIGAISCGVCGQDCSTSDTITLGLVPAIIRKYSHERFEYYKCASCDSFVLNATPDLDAYYKAYPLQSHELNAYTRAAYKKRLKRLLFAGLTKESSILDYGCGVGLFIKFLREQGFQNVRGYDPYCPAFKDSIVLGNRYDFVCCQDVIEHVPDPKDCAKKLVRLLSPGGLLEIGTPRADGLSLAKEENYRFEFSAPYHLHILSEKALATLFADTNCKIEQWYRTFYFDVPLPFFNFRFIKAYFAKCNYVLECFFEKPIPKKMLSPSVLWASIYGCFSQPKTNMTLMLRRV